MYFAVSAHHSIPVFPRTKTPNDRCLLCFQTTPEQCGLKTFDGVFSVKTESKKGSPPGLYIRLSNLETFPLRHHHCYVQCQKKVTPGQNFCLYKTLIVLCPSLTHRKVLIFHTAVVYESCFLILWPLHRLGSIPVLPACESGSLPFLLLDTRGFFEAVRCTEGKHL